MNLDRSTLIACVLLGLIVAIPSLLLARIGYVEVYVYPQLAVAFQGIVKGSVDMYTLKSPGYPLTLQIISQVCGFSPTFLLYLPLGALLLIIMFFTLSKKIFGSWLLSVLFAVYAAWDPSLAGLYSVGYYSLTFPLYLAFILLGLKMLENRHAKLLSLMYILFVGVLFVHPEAPIWMIASLTGLSLLVLASKTTVEHWTMVNSSSQTLLSFVIMFLAFNRIFYDVWLPKFQHFNPLTSISLLLTSRMNVGSSTSDTYLSSVYSPLFNWLRIFQYVVIIIPIIPVAIMDIRKFAKTKRLELRENQTYICLFSMLLVTAFVDVFAYSVAGWISLKYVGFMFPLLTIAALNRLNARKWLSFGVMAVLVLLSFSSGFSYLQSFQSGLTTYADSKGSSSWLFRSFEGSKTILTDVSTYGRFLIDAARTNSSFLPRFYNSNLYELVWLNRSSSLRNMFNFLIVDYRGSARPLQTIENKYYKAIGPHLGTLENKLNLDKIYDDNITLIFVNGER